MWREIAFYSRGQKYWYPCTFFKSLTTFSKNKLKLTKVFGLHNCFSLLKLQNLCFWFRTSYILLNEKIKINGIDKIIETLHLIFVITAFGQNNCSQALPIAMNELPTPLYWQFGQTLFLCKLLQFSQIWMVPSPSCCFQISPQVFNGI